MVSSVVSKPRFPRNSVGPGGCFCTLSIFCAVLVCPVVFAPAGASAPSAAAGAGRPVKSSPKSRRKEY